MRRTITTTSVALALAVAALSVQAQAQTAPPVAEPVRARYLDWIQSKVRGNIVVPPGVQGNPEAVFAIDQLPDGTVVNVRLVQSSGNPALDAAIERAIRRSSPLPLPEDKRLFERTLTLRLGAL